MEDDRALAETFLPFSISSPDLFEYEVLYCPDEGIYSQWHLSLCAFWRKERLERPWQEAVYMVFLEYMFELAILCLE